MSIQACPLSFADQAFQSKKKQTKRKKFLTKRLMGTLEHLGDRAR